MTEQTEQEKLHELLRAYGEGEPTQEPREASTDNQLKSLALIISDIISKSPQGTVLDVGCGKGTILSKLATLKSFKDNTPWNYLGADYSHLHDPVLQLAIELRIHRRCDVTDIANLY
jgi:tRNA G46 methylase TrmB